MSIKMFIGVTMGHGRTTGRHVTNTALVVGSRGTEKGIRSHEERKSITQSRAEPICCLAGKLIERDYYLGE